MVSYLQPTIKPLALPTQEPSNESDEDSNTDVMPTIYKGDVKLSILEDNANDKFNMVEEPSMKNKRIALEKTHDVVGQICVLTSNSQFFTSVKIYLYHTGNQFQD